MNTYFIYSAATGQLKIGKSTKPTKRLANLQTAHGVPLTLLGTLPGDVERVHHKQFEHLRVSGEWFRLDAALCTYVKSLFTVSDAVRKSFGSFINRKLEPTPSHDSTLLHCPFVLDLDLVRTRSTPYGDEVLHFLDYASPECNCPLDESGDAEDSEDHFDNGCQYGVWEHVAWRLGELQSYIQKLGIEEDGHNTIHLTMLPLNSTKRRSVYWEELPDLGWLLDEVYWTIVVYAVDPLDRNVPPKVDAFSLYLARVIHKRGPVPGPRRSIPGKEQLSLF